MTELACRVCDDTGEVPVFRRSTWLTWLGALRIKREVRLLCCQVCDTGRVLPSDIECDPDIY